MLPHEKPWDHVGLQRSSPQPVVYHGVPWVPLDSMGSHGFPRENTTDPMGSNGIPTALRGVRWYYKEVPAPAGSMGPLTELVEFT